MIIDGHIHAAGPYASPQGILQKMAHFGLDRVVLCPGLKNNTHIPELPGGPFPFTAPASIFLLNRLCRWNYHYLLRDHGDGNALVYQLVRACPEKIVQFYWVNPLERDCVEHLEQALRQWSIKGIKLHQACHSFEVQGKAMNEIAQFAGVHNLPIFLHLYDGQDVVDCMALAAAHPSTNFLLAHLIGLEMVAPHAARLQNIYYDISGGDLISSERILYAVKSFRADHIIFGSDAPFASIRRGLEKIRRLPISNTDQERILGDTLSRLLENRQQ